MRESGFGQVSGLGGGPVPSLEAVVVPECGLSFMPAGTCHRHGEVKPLRAESTE